jgi:DNA-directed RNA polymerase specialized sigma24 family protein
MSDSPIHDTFGDDRRDIDYEEYIAGNERLLKLKAGERLRHNQMARDIWDDVLQEGRIVQWQVLKRRPESTSQYVSGAMSHRITEVIQRDAWTGSEAKRGHPIDPLRRHTERDSVDDETMGIDEIVDSSDWVDEVIRSYHDGEIAEAMAALTFTQKQHVYARFWCGMTEDESAALQGVSKATVSRHWTNDIRPRLARKLELLAGM